MKSKDLRLGNYINDYNDNTLEVIGLQGELIYSIYPEQIHLKNPTTNPLEIKPIPLTEDWLLKFGFDKKIYSDEGGQYDFEYHKDISYATKMVIQADFSFQLEEIDNDMFWVDLDFFGEFVC
jgi:hypothetical protein